MMLLSSCSAGAQKNKSGQTTFSSNKNVQKMELSDQEWKERLTDEQYYILREKGTERPFTGKFVFTKDKGTYKCAGCGEPLFTDDMKFESHCGWPSFDQEIAGAVKRIPDADGQRTEIICNNCGAHLGHVFVGEGFTPKNTRHCVNSISLKFIPINTDKHGSKTENDG